MRLSSLDPISLNTVSTLADAPYVVEGMGLNALVIFFENEANKSAYLDFRLHSEDCTASRTHSGVRVQKSSEPRNFQENQSDRAGQ